nr:PREDICTED: ubiquitin carboxyl-terminal hydrolase 8-like [Bemisia tabaci]XP_018916324.1 PREDICTED: ubiquitin carboxyl-terminal hydrolase 8-like [Bemisia tabaci]
MHLKDLRFRSKTELKAACQVPLETLKKVAMRSDRSTYLTKILAEGEKSLRKGDQESAYRHFMTYIEIVSYIQRSENDKKYLTSMFGSTAMETISVLEKLDEELVARYEERILKETQTNEKNAKSQLHESNGEILPSSETTAPKPEKKIKDGQKSIGPQVLSQLMKDALLLVDVRPSEEFNHSHVVHDSIINIPPSILKQSKTANQIEKVLAEPFKSLWAQRRKFKYIILIDEYSSEDGFSPESPLDVALQAINNWDPNTKYENKAVFLNGGYAEWMNSYPFRTTNPNVQFPSHDISLLSLEDIRYPNMFDEPKPVVVPKPTPIIPDRAKKPITNDSMNHVPNISVLKTPSNVPTSEDVSKPLDDRVMNQGDENTGNSTKFAEPEEPITKTVEESPTPNVDVNLKINGDPEPSKSNINMNGDIAESQIIFHRLKPDGYSEIMPSHSGMKRSLSMPKINQLSEEGAGAAPIPTIDRSSKPQSQRNTDNYKIRDLRDSDPVHGKVTPGLTGLKNLRNTCYMNSILQCLSNTQPLNQFFHATKDFKKNHESKTEGTIAEEFRTVIIKLWAGEYKSFACKNLKNRIGHYRNTFSGYDQQDSHEFLTILIDWLHEDLKGPPQQSFLAGASEESGERAWGEFKKNNHSPIQELFYGQQRSVVTCTKCHERSITFEPFSNLSLPLPSGTDVCTLKDCLDLYVQAETILGWECPKCKTSRNAVKKLDITRLPPILVIHFKRFTSDGWCRKQQTYVDFPVNQTLDMSNFLFGIEHRNVHFSLYAVSNHYGTMDSGHYTAYCKTAKTLKWYKFDDQEVCEISPDSVKTAAAYIVFYSKLDLDNT